ncbi:MAG: proton-conducting transporter membrane subunit, partial [Pseudomonadota bacterium]
MDIFQTLGFALPELLLAIGAMALLIVGLYAGERAYQLMSQASVALLAAALALTVFASGGGVQSLFDGAFRIDAFATFSKAIIVIAAAFAVVMSQRFEGGDEMKRFEYPVLIVLAAFGMALMVSATDLISLYMGIETQSLALYVLAAINRDSRRSTEAGLKYFVLGALSSCLLLYGASLVYGFSGATSFEAIAEAAKGDEPNTGLVIGLVFLRSG